MLDQIEDNKKSQIKQKQVEDQLNELLHSSAIDYSCTVIKKNIIVINSFLHPIFPYKVRRRYENSILCQKMLKLGKIGQNVKECKIWHTSGGYPQTEFSKKEFYSVFNKLTEDLSIKVRRFLINGPKTIADFPSKGMSSFCKILNKGTSSICFEKLYFPRKQMQRIISACTSCEQMRFSFCIVRIENAKFRTTFRNKISILSFLNCEGVNKSDWDEYSGKVYYLLKAISQSGLRKRLEELNLGQTILKKETVMNWTNELGLEDMKISFEPEEN
ncbi:unnamed protein product [Moneuplotes crassus]|uniref:Uncharacterized protein n=1 Tax=Euplotes crassus TaxID=5936 RepID=A0AAD1Y5J0_EUPCR|nr:unnamed protein product [Moneuplotes crassus]